MDQAVADAKTEIEAFVMGAMQRVGLGEIARRGGDALRLLTSPRDEEG